jgi:hypothetical protein
MSALVMALVANSKMLSHQFGQCDVVPATNNINHLAFIPMVRIRTTPRTTFSVANLHVNHLRPSNGGAQKVRAIRSGHRADRWRLPLLTDTVAKLFLHH